MPFVSILIPCFNAEAWIGQAIESALVQVWPHKEVVVVDDGSTDRSLHVIKSFGDRIRWESGPNRGGNVARNRLASLARGDWLQYLDADDWLMPDKIAAQVAFIGKRPGTDIVYGPSTIEHWSTERAYLEELAIPEPHDPWVLLARWFLPQTGAVLWRKRAVVDVGGWNEDQVCCQEHELYLRLLMADKRFAFCNSGGAVYRLWSEQTVCRRDPAEVARRRLAIEDAAEGYLAAKGELTSTRQWAINQARFEIARMAWRRSREQALEIVTRIQHSQPGFRPSGAAAPPLYRLALGLLGFQLTEGLADFRRGLRLRHAGH